jgi:flagellar assembly protein FliH
MSMSFDLEVPSASSIPISLLMYRDVAAPLGQNAKTVKQTGSSTDQEPEKEAKAGPSAEEVSELLTRARAEAVAEVEHRLKDEYEAMSAQHLSKISHALESFQEERRDYFGHVESEVVHLALAIAAKILHREAQVDPMLVAALVRVAVDKLHDGSRVSVRVPSSEADRWREYLANPLNGSSVEIIADPHLDAEDCILETDLGSASFSIDAQLKEVEQGFFDLLAQRPTIK